MNHNKLMESPGTENNLLCEQKYSLRNRFFHFPHAKPEVLYDEQGLNYSLYIDI